MTVGITSLSGAGDDGQPEDGLCVLVSNFVGVIFGVVSNFIGEGKGDVHDERVAFGGVKGALSTFSEPQSDGFDDACGWKKK